MVEPANLIKTLRFHYLREYGHADYHTDYRRNQHPVLLRNIECQSVDIQRLSGLAPETMAPDALLWPCPQRMGASDLQYAHIVFLRTGG